MKIKTEMSNFHNDGCREVERLSQHHLPAIPREGFPPPLSGNMLPIPPPIPSAGDVPQMVLPPMQQRPAQQQEQVTAVPITSCPVGSYAREWLQNDHMVDQSETRSGGRLASSLRRAYAQFAKPSCAPPSQVLSEALALSSDVDPSTSGSMCFLTVLPNDPRIVVVHGLATYAKSFGAANPYQGRVLAFLGDRPDPENDDESLPPLLVAPIAPDTAESLFGSRPRRVPRREVLWRFFRECDEAPLHPVPDYIDAADEGVNLPNLAYVPAPWAVHFLGGLSPSDALRVGERLAEANLPQSCRAAADPLLQWLRAACCRRSGAPQDAYRSGMSVEWTPLLLATSGRGGVMGVDGGVRGWAVRRMRRSLGLSPMSPIVSGGDGGDVGQSVRSGAVGQISVKREEGEGDGSRQQGEEPAAPLVPPREHPPPANAPPNLVVAYEADGNTRASFASANGGEHSQADAVPSESLSLPQPPRWQPPNAVEGKCAPAVDAIPSPAQVSTGHRCISVTDAMSNDETIMLASSSSTSAGSRPFAEWYPSDAEKPRDSFCDGDPECRGVTVREEDGNGCVSMSSNSTLETFRKKDPSASASPRTSNSDDEELWREFGISKRRRRRRGGFIMSTITVPLSVEDAVKRKFIGGPKSANFHKQLQDETNCTVAVRGKGVLSKAFPYGRGQDGSEKVEVIVEGTEGGVELAERRILQLIRHLMMGTPSRQGAKGGSRGGYSAKDRGNDGDNVENLESKSASPLDRPLQFPRKRTKDDDCGGNDTSSTCGSTYRSQSDTLTSRATDQRRRDGSKRRRRNEKELYMERVDFREFAPWSGFPIDNHFMRSLIGTEGCIIKDLMRRTGCKLQVDFAEKKMNISSEHEYRIDDAVDIIKEYCRSQVR